MIRVRRLSCNSQRHCRRTDHRCRRLRRVRPCAPCVDLRSLVGRLSRPFKNLELAPTEAPRAPSFHASEKMENENPRQRHSRRKDEFNWRPGELVVGPKRRDSGVIGVLSAHNLDAVKAWIGSGCEGPQPRPTAFQDFELAQTGRANTWGPDQNRAGPPFSNPTPCADPDKRRRP